MPPLPLLFFLLFVQCARGIYFHVAQGAQRCFLEEMPGQTLLLATYSNPDFKPWGTPGFAEVAVFIDVLDPAGQPAIPRRVADTSGKVAFHSTSGGEYKLCFSTNGTRWGAAAAQKFVRAVGCDKLRGAHGRSPLSLFPAPIIPRAMNRAPLCAPLFHPLPTHPSHRSAWT